jgi:hypothetical protein
MDAKPISLASTPASAAVSPSESAASASGAALRGAEFANVFGRLMGQPERQELAAGGLQAMAIGPQMQLITGADPMPDPSSLAAFARSQGLDEATVTALFGQPVGQVSTGEMLVTAVAALPALSSLMAPGTPQTPAEGEPVMTPAALAAALAWGARSPLGSKTLPDSILATTGKSEPKPDSLGEAGVTVLPSGDASGLVLSLTALANRDALGAPGLLGNGSTLMTAGHLAAAQNQGPLALGTDAPEVPGLAGVRVSQLAWQVSQSPVAAGAAGGVGTVDGIVTDSAVMQEAARLRLQPAEDLTRRLAAMSGTGQQAVWGNVAGAGSALSERLDLRQLLGADASLTDVLTSADALPTDLERPEGLSGPGGHAGRTGATFSLPVAEAAQPASQLAQRAEHYEQLADRLGQALAQRLQSQIERGEWKVQLRMDPAQLGRIDLELDMHAGGLDAVFRSDNQVTRDLISQGMSKLRDSLSQAGTAVANVWVQGDSGRQSGGNPTPGRNPQDRGGADNSVSLGAPIAAAAAPASAKIAGADGWDMLV